MERSVSRLSKLNTLKKEELPVSLFPAAGHVVDEGAVDISAADADRIEERFEIGDEILLIRKLFIYDLGVTGLAQHHQASRDPDRFSPSTSSHSSYTDPF
jgi:hypothetical protein